MLPKVSPEFLEKKGVSSELYLCLDQILTEKVSLFKKEKKSWSIIKASVEDALVRLHEVLPAVKLLAHLPAETSLTPEQSQRVLQSFDLLKALIVSGQLLTKSVSPRQLLELLQEDSLMFGVSSIHWNFFGLWTFYVLVPFSVKKRDVSGWYFCLSVWLLGSEKAWLLGLHSTVRRCEELLDLDARNSMRNTMSLLYLKMKKRAEYFKIISFILPQELLLPYEEILTSFEDSYARELEIPSGSQLFQSPEASLLSEQEDETSLKGFLSVCDQWLLASHWEEKIDHGSVLVQPEQGVAELLYSIVRLPDIGSVDDSLLQASLALIKDAKIKQQTQWVLQAWCVKNVSHWVRSHMEQEDFILDLHGHVDRYINWVSFSMGDSPEGRALCQSWRLLLEHAHEIFSFQVALCDSSEVETGMEAWQQLLLEHQWVHEAVVSRTGCGKGNAL